MNQVHSFLFRATVEEDITMDMEEGMEEDLDMEEEDPDMEEDMVGDITEAMVEDMGGNLYLI